MKKMKRILTLALAVMMVISSVNLVPLRASAQEEEKQPLTIEKLTDDSSSIEQERTTEDAALLEIYNRVREGIPTLSDDGKSIVLPTTGDENYEISLYGTSNEAVIGMDGIVTQPLEDMNVYLYYKVVSKTTGEELHMDDPVYVKVSGAYAEGSNLLNRPSVMPAIREWKGNDGKFVFGGNLVIADEELRDAASVVEYYIEEMTGAEVDIKIGSAQAGDIALKFDDTLSVGEEGYTIDIDDITTVKATSYTGIVYAGATITQIMMQTDDHSMPKGLMRDYPQYKVRSTMLDVARFYMPLDYLEEVTKYAAFYKQNEIHIHINDNGGEQSTAFRVESKKYPAINSSLNPDEIYSQEDYKAYQKNVKKLGIDVVTEIDTPAHAGFVALYDPDLMLDGYHIDLNNDDAVNFMKSLFDEFLDGEDPVFQNSKFNIGTDEYADGHNEEMRAYMDEMIKYVNSKGCETRLWSGLNVEGQRYGGTTPVTNEAVFHYWASGFADLQVMLDGEYPMINNNDGKLYSVPEAGYYNDYINIRSLYDSWEAGIVPGGSHVKPGHPLMLGSEAALWYDIKLGCSEFDVFDRHRDQIMLMAEKNWYGEKTEVQNSADDFMKRVAILGDKAPGVNPDRQVESESEIIVDYDFGTLEGSIVEDKSGNGYDAFVTGLKADNGMLVLNGKGYISLPFDSVGYPYTVEFEMNISSATGENAVLFTGKDGTMYYNYDGTGKIGYERKGYTYLFDYDITENVMNRFALTCNTPDVDGELRLYVNGAEVADGEYYNVANSSREESSTFVLPTEEVGSGIRGSLKSMKISNKVSAEIVQGADNIALNKQVTVSGVEGGYLDNGSLKYPQFEPQNAVDGSTGTRISLNQSDDAWLYVDLGEEYIINKTVIRFNETPLGYELQISNDAENWDTVMTRTGLQGQTRIDEIFEPDEPVKARYVKYQQLQRFPAWGSYYSGNFSEFEVYGITLNEVDQLMKETEAVLESVSETENNAAFLKALRERLNELKVMLENEDYSGIATVMKLIRQQLKDLNEGNTEAVESDKDELKKLINENIDLSIYSQDSAARYSSALLMGQNVYADVQSSQEVVDSAAEAIKAAKLSLQIKEFATVTSNCAIYNNNNPELVLDGDTGTTFWKNGYQKNGDYLLISFREPFSLEKVRLVADRDILKYGELQVSSDGVSFAAVSTLEETQDQTITLEAAKEVMAIRVIATADNEDAWWRMNEICLNDGLSVDKKVLEGELNKVIDSSLYTEQSYQAYETARTAAEEVFNNPDAKQSEVDAQVENIRTAIRQLASIVNKDRLNQYLENIIENDNNDKYSEESYISYLSAIEKGREIAGDANVVQRDVDAAVWAISEAIVYLEVTRTDKEALKIIMDEAEEIDSALYTAESIEVLNNAIEQAQEVYDDSEATQTDIDNAVESLRNAIAGLEKNELLLPEELPYKDVSEDDWFYDYVYDVYVKELMTGLEETIFAPNNNIVRAQFAVILYRMEGKPEVTYKDTFPDVKEGNFYSDAVIWAAENGIVTGYTDTGLFGPNDPITREQMAAMMFRYANYKKLDTKKREDLSGFPDGKNVQVFATDAVQWCVAEGIISGKGEEGAKILDPQASTCRAEAATIISRYTEVDR